MATVETKVVRFVDGAGVVHTDFNNLQNLMVSRFWDLDQYGNMFSIWPVADQATLPDVQWSAPTFLATRAFSRGHGCFPFAGASSSGGGALNSSMTRGILGIYEKASEPDLVTPSMRWVLIPDDSTVAFLHNTNAVASERFDIVTVAIAEVAKDSVVLDFEDAVTRALTTTATDTRTALEATFTLTEGTAGAGVPAIPAGEHLVYVTRLPPSSGIIDFEGSAAVGPADMLLPYGTMHAVRCGFPAFTWPFTAASWTVEAGGGLEAIDNVGEAIGILGWPASNPYAKLMGFATSADFDALTSITIGAYQSANNFELLVNGHSDIISAEFDLGSGFVDHFVHTEGPPFSTVGPFFGGEFPLFRGNKGLTLGPALLRNIGLALKFVGRTGDELREVTAFWMVPA